VISLATVLAALLILEAFGTARSLVSLLGSLRGYDALTLVLLTIRAAIGAGELVGGMLLWRRQPVAGALVPPVLLASAILRVFETGFRVTPTDADPTFRWWIVGGYGLYAMIAAWLVRRADLSGPPNRRA
jgi:hypothetical protein